MKTVPERLILIAWLAWFPASLCLWPARTSAQAPVAPSAQAAQAASDAAGAQTPPTATVAEPQAGADAQTHWEVQSVHELMQQDLREALRAAAASSASAAGGPAGGAVRPVLAPRLVALYGVGSALMAEVQVAGRAYLYVRGQAWPAGHVGDQGVYQLRGMNGACVQLERGEDRHSLCLRMLLGEVQP